MAAPALLSREPRPTPVRTLSRIKILETRSRGIPAVQSALEDNETYRRRIHIDSPLLFGVQISPFRVRRDSFHPSWRMP